MAGPGFVRVTPPAGRLALCRTLERMELAARGLPLLTRKGGAFKVSTLPVFMLSFDLRVWFLCAAGLLSSSLA